MSIAINKKISQIHWSAFVAAGLCFFSAGHIYNEYREVKFLIEQGNIVPGIAINTCRKYSRSGNYIKVNILSQNRQADVKVDAATCEETNIGDTIIIYCTNNFKRIVQYDPKVKTTNKKNLSFSILSALLGISFLLFGNKKRLPLQ
jgi:aspartate 1-decarboxylase